MPMSPIKISAVAEFRLCHLSRSRFNATLSCFCSKLTPNAHLVHAVEPIRRSLLVRQAPARLSPAKATLTTLMVSSCYAIRVLPSFYAGRLCAWLCASRTCNGGGISAQRRVVEVVVRQERGCLPCCPLNQMHFSFPMAASSDNKPASIGASVLIRRSVHRSGCGY
jgi:hypothetical protein